MCVWGTIRCSSGSSCAFNKESLSITIIWTHNYTASNLARVGKECALDGPYPSRARRVCTDTSSLWEGRPLLAQEACCILQISTPYRTRAYCSKTQLVFGSARLGFRFKCCFCQRRIYMSMCVCKCSPYRFFGISEMHTQYMWKMHIWLIILVWEAFLTTLKTAPMILYWKRSVIIIIQSVRTTGRLSS